MLEDILIEAFLFLPLLVFEISMFVTKHVVSLVRTSVFLFLPKHHHPHGRGGISTTTTSLLKSSLSSSGSSSVANNPFTLSRDTETVHVVVLVHGWLGNPMEMYSIQQSLEEHVQKQQRDNATENTCQFVIHSAQCNEENSTDGIPAGGKRLAKEVNDILNALRQQLQTNNQISRNSSGSSTIRNNKDVPVITLSFIGNSLGGLYARYALKDIFNTAATNDDDTDNAVAPIIAIQPKVFMTTATPHLGKSGQTYVSVPRVVEKIIGKVLLPTGQDLFSSRSSGQIDTDIVERMTVDEAFVQPLRRFQKRIAYINACGTDFQVPTNTAAFLSQSIESIHYPTTTTTSNNNDNSNNDNNNDMIRLCVTTPQRNVNETQQKSTITSDNKSSSIQRKADEMAVRLDAMGWTKVFCDVRSRLIPVPIPTGLFNPLFRSRQQQQPKTIAQSNDDNKNTHRRQALQRRLVNSNKATTAPWTSSELRSLFGNNLVDENNKWYIPFGHTVLIANSKSKFYAKLNAGGKPLVDRMARDFINDVLHL